MKPTDVDAVTWLVAAGRPDRPGEPLNAPLVPASNFLLGTGRVYSRDGGTPGWDALETLVGGLEGGEAVAFASGMAAAAAVFDGLPAGARVALPEDCYHGVSELAREGEAQGAEAANGATIPFPNAAAQRIQMIKDLQRTRFLPLKVIKSVLEQSDAESLISALVALYRENASTLTPDPLYSAFHDTHPPASIRIAHLKRLAHAG